MECGRCGSRSGSCSLRLGLTTSTLFQIEAGPCVLCLLWTCLGPSALQRWGGEHAIPKLMDFRVSRCWTSGSPAVGLPGLQHCKQTPFLCKPCSFSYRSHAMAFCHSNRKQATSAESLPGLIPGNQSPELTSKHIRHTSRCFPVQLGLGCILRAPT